MSSKRIENTRDKLLDIKNSLFNSTKTTINDLNIALDNVQKNKIVLKSRNLPTVEYMRKVIDLEKHKKSIYEIVQKVAESDKNIYLNFGGVGDLILLLAECYKDKNGIVLFFCNNHSKSFAEEILNFFEMEYHLHDNIMGTKSANIVHDTLYATGRLKQSAHLPKGLNFYDWKTNESFYKEKMVLETDWKNYLGCIPEIVNKKILVICPCGSFKSTYTQRYISAEEYVKIINCYIEKGYEIYSVGGEKERLYFPHLPNKPCRWITTEKIYEANGKTTPINTSIFFKYINSATEVISVDTWLKSYSALAGIPTKVILSRRSGKYMNYGDAADNYMFINKNLWKHMDLVKIEDLLVV